MTMSFFEQPSVGTEKASMIRRETTLMQTRVRMHYRDTKDMEVKDYISLNTVDTQIGRALKVNITDDGVYVGNYPTIDGGRQNVESIIIKNIEKIRDLAIEKMASCESLPTALIGTLLDKNRDVDDEDDEDDIHLTMEEEYEKFIDSFEEGKVPFRKYEGEESHYKYYLDYPQQKKLPLFKFYKKTKLHKYLFFKTDEYKERERRKNLERNLKKQEEYRLKKEAKKAKRQARKEAEMDYYVYQVIQGEIPDESFGFDEVKTVKKKKKSRKKHFKKLDARAEGMSEGEYHCEVIKAINFVDSRIDFDIMEMEESNQNKISEDEVQAYIKLREWFCRFGVAHQIRIPELKGIVRDYKGKNASKDAEDDWLFKEKEILERAEMQHRLKSAPKGPGKLNVMELLGDIIETDSERLRDMLVGDDIVDISIIKFELIKALFERTEGMIKRIEPDFLEEILRTSRSVNDIKSKLANMTKEELTDNCKYSKSFHGGYTCDVYIKDIIDSNIITYIENNNYPIDDMAKTVVYHYYE